MNSYEQENTNFMGMDRETKRLKKEDLRLIHFMKFHCITMIIFSRSRRSFVLPGQWFQRKKKYNCDVYCGRWAKNLKEIKHGLLLETVVDTTANNSFAAFHLLRLWNCITNLTSVWFACLITFEWLHVHMKDL